MFLFLFAHNIKPFNCNFKYPYLYTMPKEKKDTKPRGNYDEKLKVEMSFDELIKKAGEHAKQNNIKKVKATK